MNANDEMQLRNELVDHYKKIDALALTELSSGNVSVRFGERMLISANGAAAETITPETIVNTAFDGEYIGDRKPSSEWRMHAAIYARHAEAQAIVHTHSDYCVAVASHVRALPGFHYLVGVFGGDDVPCVPYATFGTQTLANDAAAALTHRTACLLGNHGMICRAPNLTRAVKLAQRLEIMCRQYVLSRQLGEPRHLTAAEWHAFHHRSIDNQYGRQG